MKEMQILMRIRLLIWLMIAGLVISGITAFPIQSEVNLLADFLEQKNIHGAFSIWIHMVSFALNKTAAEFPFLAYGTDWLAFAHLVIAAAFLGPLKDPRRNSWVIDWGLIASIMVIPLALIAGPIRGIPFFHQLIDCSFGIVGFGLLFYCRNLILNLTYSSAQNTSYS